MTVAIAAKNIMKKMRRSIMPLSVVLLVLSTIITVLLAALVMMPNLVGNKMEIGGDICGYAIMAIFIIFLIVFIFFFILFLYSYLFRLYCINSMIIQYNKLCSFLVYSFCAKLND